VPYAYAARNGVPTGSIMPFIGTTAPLGWLLCDGGDIEIADYTLALRNLLGVGVSTTPNLQGMFLRGAGTSPLSTPTVVKAGPALRSTQEDSNKLHVHDVGSLATSEDGEHVHSNGTLPDAVYNRVAAVGVGFTVLREPVIQSTRMDNIGSEPMTPAGDHTHTITGNTGDSGDTESRPVNYGVNYIIKL
jgi:microcystin-dependent protein